MRLTANPIALVGPTRIASCLARVRPVYSRLPTEQYIVLHEERKDHHRVLTALRFVDRHRPGQSQFGEIGVIVGHRSLHKLDHDLLFFQVNGGDRADIAIKNFALVVVDVLDHPVSYPQDTASTCQFHLPWRRRVQHLLEQGVELPGADLSAGGRTQYLHLAHRVDAMSGQELTDQVTNALPLPALVLEPPAIGNPTFRISWSARGVGTGRH